LPSDLVRAPRVGEAPVAMECRLVEVHQIAGTQNYLVLGEVVRVHLAERIWVNGRVDPARLRPVGRLAGSGFAHLGELFSMERPTYRGLLEAGAKPVPDSIMTDDSRSHIAKR
jgi:flavin reductase (DIM6/NTAB) family NADH-FMN oxidoreductase RutF